MINVKFENNPNISVLDLLKEVSLNDFANEMLMIGRGLLAPGTEKDPNFLADALTLASNSKGAIGAEFNYKFDEEGTKAEIKAMFLTDDDLLCKEAGLFANVSHLDEIEKEYKTEIKTDVLANITMSYGVKKISTPNFDKYQLIPLYLIEAVGIL